MTKKPEKKRRFPIVEVHWRDAVHECDNSTLTSPMKPTVLVTVGYLVYGDENTEFLNVANEVCPQEAQWARHISCIPMENIIEWEEICK